jgi:23S rRNA pseudouridine1911/1915/1917 synthase
MQLEILAETPQYIVVVKPAGINVEKWDGFTSVEQLVFDYLKTQKPQSEPFVGVVHRLDRAVSGVLVLAKKKSTLKLLNLQFAEHKTDKKYQAIVENKPAKDKDALIHFLFVNNKLKKAEVFLTKQKDTHECRLNYHFIKKANQGFLLEIKLLTGKFHQIRAQLSSIGCPIVGDEKYGAKTFFQKDAIALHACQLSFFDPISNEKLTFSKMADFWI